MLKFTYTETGFHIERLTQSLEEWVTARVILALRVGCPICVEPSTAAFLLPANLPGLDLLQTEIIREGNDAVSLCIADHEYVEVSLKGTWVAGDPATVEGVFVTNFSCTADLLIFQLWYDSQAATSCLHEAGD